MKYKHFKYDLGLAFAAAALAVTGALYHKFIYADWTGEMDTSSIPVFQSLEEINGPLGQQRVRYFTEPHLKELTPLAEQQTPQEWLENCRKHNERAQDQIQCVNDTGKAILRAWNNRKPIGWIMRL